MSNVKQLDHAVDTLIRACLANPDRFGYAYATGYLESLVSGMATELEEQGKNISEHTRYILRAAAIITEESANG
jgi:hypothetical protein